VTIISTRERLEAASNEPNGKILLGRPIVMTFKRVPKKVVTGETKVKARVISEEVEEGDSQEPRRDSRKPPGTYSHEQSLPGEGLLGTYLDKSAPENPPVPLSSLFPEDCASTDSDEDLAEELDEFFRFMIWNDLSENRKKKIQVLLKMKSVKALFLLRNSLLKLMILMTSSLMILMTLMMTDILPQVSDNRVRFSPFAQEARYGFSLQDKPKTFRRRL